jgi:hypothetical protein
LQGWWRFNRSVVGSPIANGEWIYLSDTLVGKMLEDYAALMDSGTLFATLTIDRHWTVCFSGVGIGGIEFYRLLR